MQAIRFETQAIPKVRSPDLLVRVRVAGLNRADVLQRQGFYGEQPDFGNSVIPGLEIAGRWLMWALPQLVSGAVTG